MADKDFTDRRFQGAVASLARASSRRAVIRANPPTKPRPTIPAASGVGSVGAGAGVASPFTEPDANARTYHTTPRTVTSTDGVFTIEIQDIETVEMEDANGNAVEFEFDQPS